MKTRLDEVPWELELGEFKYIGYIRLGGFYEYPYTPTLFTSGSFRLGGPQRGFSLSILVSSLITHLGVISSFASLFPYSLYLLSIVYAYALESPGLIALHLLLFCT